MPNNQPHQQAKLLSAPWGGGRSRTARLLTGLQAPNKAPVLCRRPCVSVLGAADKTEETGTVACRVYELEKEETAAS